MSQPSQTSEAATTGGDDRGRTEGTDPGRRGGRKAKPLPKWAQNPIGRLVHDWVVPLGVAVAVLTPLRSSLADWNDVPSGSMRPTILEGDRIWVNKLAYGLRVPFTHTWVTRWDEPARGDIVTLASPADGTRLVKRIVGLPGDHIAMHANRLMINGREMDYAVVDQHVMEPLPGSHQKAPALHVQEMLGSVRHMLTIVPGVSSASTFDEIVIPDGMYMVMGDNRDLSGDSRLFGFVRRGDIYGRVGGVAISVDPDNYYMPRFGRWFMGLR